MCNSTGYGQSPWQDAFFDDDAPILYRYRGLIMHEETGLSCIVGDFNLSNAIHILGWITD